MVPWLEPGAPFPDTRDALTDPDGLLAAGADLSPGTLIRAYSAGIFPWYDADYQPILWWSPAPRCVFYPDQIHVSRSLKRHINKTEFTVTLNQAFSSVMTLCAGPRRDGGGTWISSEMISAYLRLHQMGYAHSLEIWQEGQIAGGIYGIQLGRVFFGESMVSPRLNGSKMALVALKQLASTLDIALLDAQVENDHLTRMGASMIDRDTFRQHLAHWIPAAPEPSIWPQTHWHGSELLDYKKPT
ncbi:MAG: leucyl/phenylalanyl-tRNA--protein transferase [Pseudomonadota bacterium]|uniref:leucyl/phenylalanyl-tRNA--protein transferase n=1 Tax=Alcanivorax sp. TaxID=1872427 RepID=UPI0025C0C04C|nr:leucyl/phenylalanyl-tRNA--protein transferase [Alcanivorax sp.]MED5238365.1 leucyl/phenylalanyl-tRNA--protein transferase [Pseudomonadota bacterium]MEE3320211.1 leucyl/phenylalanyl-tRNA--protein transferase [Pseudomonadota bacterium]